jgi:hypothetical protein
MKPQITRALISLLLLAAAVTVVAAQEVQPSPDTAVESAASPSTPETPGR